MTAEPTQWWLQHLGLTKDDHEILLSNSKWLNDKHMAAASKILSTQFPDVNGLHSPTRVPFRTDFAWHYPDRFPPVSSPAVQIHHNSADHWVTSVCSGDDVFLLDSAATKPTSSLEIQLAALYSKTGSDLKINIPSIQRQTTGNCGVFAIANAVEFCITQSTTPSIAYKATVMRSHLIGCLEAGCFTQFPFGPARTKRRKSSVHVIPISCPCGLPDIMDNMVCCDNCDTWWHQCCIDFNQTESPVVCLHCK